MKGFKGEFASRERRKQRGPVLLSTGNWLGGRIGAG